MSVNDIEIKILDKATYVEKMDTQNALLAAIASGAGSVQISNFKDLHQLVRLGLAPKLFKVGDQIKVEKDTSVSISKDSTGITAVSVAEDTFVDYVDEAINGYYEFEFDGDVWKLGEEVVDLTNYGISITGTPAEGDRVIVHETAAELIFNIIGIDVDGSKSVTLQLDQCYANIQFDSPEAFYYCSSQLAAGSYKFTLPDWDSSYGGNQTYYFTLTSAVPAGGQLMFPWGYQQQASAVKVSSYKSAKHKNAIESVSVTTTPIADAVDLGTLNGELACNHVHKIRYGNNRYAHSAIRQWMNSDKKGATTSGSGADEVYTGGWWNPQNNFDRPSANVTDPGFLHGIDPEFKKMLGAVSKTVAKNTVMDGGGTESLSDKVFLLANEEMNLSNPGVSESSVYPYWSGSTNADRVKYLAGSARYYWLRSPTRSDGYIVYAVDTGGSLDYFSAYDSHGAVPACVII